MSFEQFKSDMVKAIEAKQAEGIKLVYGLNYVIPTDSEEPCGLCAMFMLYCWLTEEKVQKTTEVFSKLTSRYDVQSLAVDFIAGYDGVDDDQYYSRGRVYDFGREIRTRFGAVSGPTLNEKTNYQFQVWSGEYHFEGFISDEKEHADNFVKSLKEIGGKSYVVRVLKGKLPTRTEARTARLLAFPELVSAG